MARPTKKVKRTESVTVRFTKAEKRVVVKFAEKSGLRVAEFIHERTLDHKVQTRLNDEEITFYRKLTGMANNLNQLTKHTHQRGLLTNEILHALQEINKLIDRIK